MNTSSHDFVTVDMRGLKAALVARARAQRVSVSVLVLVLVRGAVARDLRLALGAEPPPSAASVGAASKVAWVKLSIRLTPEEAERLAAGARAAGLSRGAYLAGLVADVPVLTTGASRADHLAALVASSAELLTLSRNIHHLTTLLRQGEFGPARVYREMLDTLAGDIRSHLVQASGLLADLRPRGRRTDPAQQPKL
jgi:hypothetical protein